MTNQLTSRIGWIDTAKGIGLICVILGRLGIPYVASWVYFKRSRIHALFGL